MKKFKLYVVKAGHRDESKFEIVKGFKDAEERAKELFEAAWKDYPCDDTYVDCVESEYELQEDHLVMVKDYYGEVYWKKMVFGDFGLCPLYARLLDDDEDAELQEWREEVERNVFDLSQEELKKLRGQICVGSVYLSDYDNEFNIDESALYNECESYLYWLDEEKHEDTPDEFAYYIKEVA